MCTGFFGLSSNPLSAVGLFPVGDCMVTHMRVCYHTDFLGFWAIFWGKSGENMGKANSISFLRLFSLIFTILSGDLGRAEPGAYPCHSPGLVPG
jgi:hypothetical protein